MNREGYELQTAVGRCVQGNAYHVQTRALESGQHRIALTIYRRDRDGQREALLEQSSQMLGQDLSKCSLPLIDHVVDHTASGKDLALRGRPSRYLSCLR